MTLVAPELNRNAFHCPFTNCEAYSKQRWFQVFWYQQTRANQAPAAREVPHLHLAVCDHCDQYSVWFDGQLIFPATRTAPAPHPEITENVKPDYEEARAVFSNSPRSSAALLRLAIQKICIALGLSGRNLNEDIGVLVKQGLPIQVQQSLDIVRVVGNNQVHPGVLDVRDDADMATRLFELVNIIVEDRIARPKRIAELYAKLPENARKQIEERDSDSKASV